MISVALFPSCFISGGQTGADRAGLDFALAHNFAIDGFCPRDRRANDGPLHPRYILRETESRDFPERTRRNVLLADATVIFSRKPLDVLRVIKRGSGSALTVRECERAARPFIVLSAAHDVVADAAALRAFLCRVQPESLNVAGNAEDKAPGTYRHVFSVLEYAASMFSNYAS